MENNKLFLLWQNKETRSWYHVGNLIHENDKYFYKYQTDNTKRNVFEALRNGYKLHPTFPDVNQKYESNVLFSAFSRRLPNMDRKDYRPLLKHLGITRESTEFEIMSITGGSINSDNYEFLKPIEHDGTKFKLDFYLRGWRHYNELEDEINDDDRLSLVIEDDNSYDEDAVAVYKNKETLIGYVPAFYSTFITKMIESERDYEDIDYALEYSFDYQAPSQFKIEMTITGIDYKGLLKMDYESAVVPSM